MVIFLPEIHIRCIISFTIISVLSTIPLQYFAHATTAWCSTWNNIVAIIHPELPWEPKKCPYIWWRHQMETFSALLAICAGNLPVTGEFPAQRPVTRSLDVLFDLRLNKRLSKQWWGWWFGTPLCPLWRHCMFCFTGSWGWGLLMYFSTSACSNGSR